MSASEGHELYRGVAGRRIARYLAGPGVEGGEQGERSVPTGFKAVTLRSPGRQRQDGILAVQRLNRRFFVRTEP